MTVPLSLIQDLDFVPRDRPVTLLLRHSARYPILDPDEPYLAGLTPEGVTMAEELGVLLGAQYGGGRLLSAPVGRCLDTAQAIARGAGWPAQAQADERLSHPFIAPAYASHVRGEWVGLIPWQVKVVLGLLLENAGCSAQLDVMVTHDTIVATLVGSLLKAPVWDEFWPGYLEGVFVWRDGAQVRARWRGEEWGFQGEELIRD